MQQLARSMATDAEPLLRQRVVGTAAVYFWKFYLRRDFCDADPRLLAPACLFLASKTGGRGLLVWACCLLNRNGTCDTDPDSGWAAHSMHRASRLAARGGQCRSCGSTCSCVQPDRRPGWSPREAPCFPARAARTHSPRRRPACPAAPGGAEETPVHSKLLLHYARRLCTKHGALPPPDLAQLVTAEATLLVGHCCRGCKGADAGG